MHRNVLYYGNEQPQPEAISLRAGPLSAIFQNGHVRCIRLGDKEVVRRIYGAVRDEYWNTIPATISNLEVADEGRSFRIGFDCEHHRNSIHFCWRCEIQGFDNARIHWSMDGAALKPFLRNRIGLCVTHPIGECAGRPCRVENVDGSLKHSGFPQSISPHQVFLDVRALNYEIVPGIVADIRFEGATFETEDQRNWCDTSFKTYSTPLSLPHPTRITRGEVVKQRVQLSVSTNGLPICEQRNGSSAGCIDFTIGEATGAVLPAIGLGASDREELLTREEVSRLRALHLSHLRVHLEISYPGYREMLSRAVAEADLLSLPLEVSLSASRYVEQSFKEFVQHLALAKPRISRWLIPSSLLQVAPRYLTSAPIFAGTAADFADINRNRPEPNGCDGLCFSLNPQVHGFDNETLVENLSAQMEIVRAARGFAEGKPIAISPVTLKPRAVHEISDQEAPADLPSDVDARQMSLFGAGWTLVSIKNLSESGASSATFYETLGWRGVMESAQGSPAPSLFPSIPSSVFPMYHVFADVGECRGADVVASSSTHPLLIEGIVLQRLGKVRLLLANLSGDAQRVHIRSALFGGGAELKVLDETNAEAACVWAEEFRNSPAVPLMPVEGSLEFILKPYAIVRLDARGVRA